MAPQHTDHNDTTREPSQSIEGNSTDQDSGKMDRRSALSFGIRHLIGLQLAGSVVSAGYSYVQEQERQREREELLTDARKHLESALATEDLKQVVRHLRDFQDELRSKGFTVEDAITADKLKSALRPLISKYFAGIEQDIGNLPSRDEKDAYDHSMYMISLSDDLMLLSMIAHHAGFTISDFINQTQLVAVVDAISDEYYSDILPDSKKRSYFGSDILATTYVYDVISFVDELHIATDCEMNQASLRRKQAEQIVESIDFNNIHPRDFNNSDSIAEYIDPLRQVCGSREPAVRVAMLLQRTGSDPREIFSSVEKRRDIARRTVKYLLGDRRPAHLDQQHTLQRISSAIHMIPDLEPSEVLNFSFSGKTLKEVLDQLDVTEDQKEQALRGEWLKPPKDSLACVEMALISNYQ